MRDKFLNFNRDTGDVSLTRLAEQINSFKELKKSDPTKTKVAFKSQLKVLFFVYSTDSPYVENYTPAQRKSFVYTEHVTQTAKRLETYEFKLCEKLLLRHGMSREEAQFQQILMDFDQFHDRLNSIPWEREITETSKQGKKITTRKWMVSNMDERMKAIKASKDIFTLQKDLAGIVAGKKATADTKAHVRDFENAEYIEMLNRSLPELVGGKKSDVDD